MTTLSKNERIGEITSIRGKVKSNPTLHVELLAAVTRTLRDHGVLVDNRIVSEIAIALPEEITSELDNLVVLPGGTNC